MPATRALRPGSMMRRGSAPGAVSTVSIIRSLFRARFYKSLFLLPFSPSLGLGGTQVTKKSGSRGAHSQKPIGLMRIHPDGLDRRPEYSHLPFWRKGRFAKVRGGQGGLANGSFTKPH